MSTCLDPQISFVWQMVAEGYWGEAAVGKGKRESRGSHSISSHRYF